MRVFVTGSTGFVGTAVVKELLLAGHQVLGLTRSDKGAEQLKTQGAEALHGTLEDLESLKKGASGCDAAIHLAFDHGFSNFAASCVKDRAAITALGDALVAAGGDTRSLVVTSGTMVLDYGVLGTEDAKISLTNPRALARGPSEQVCLDYAKKGLRASVIRLPPVTHGPGSSGFAGVFAYISLQKGSAAYIGDGQNRWCAGHRDDAAVVYRLAMEKAEPGSIFHAVGEEGVFVKDIADAVGKELGLPVVSLDATAAADQFGWFQFGVGADGIASSQKTQEWLGWKPTHAKLLEDIPAIVEFAKSYKGF